MIYVTQGHEKGIGLEIFFRSLIFFSKNEQQNITLIINKNELAFYDPFLRSLNIKILTFNKGVRSNKSGKQILKKLNNLTMNSRKGLFLIKKRRSSNKQKKNLNKPVNNNNYLEKEMEEAKR